MKKWTIGLLASIMMLVSVPVSAQISAPDKVDAHKPIIVEAQAEADVYIWNVPSPAVKIVVDSGRGLHVWAPPGKYEIRLTTISVDVKVDPDWKPDGTSVPDLKKNIQYNEHFATIEVLGSGPSPNPNPNPNPNPSNAFKQKITAALTKVDEAGLTFRGKVADVYANICQEVEANPEAWDAATMVNEAKVRVATALPSATLKSWAGFWPGLGKAFKEQGLKASDLDGHVAAFKQVVEVLEK